MEVVDACGQYGGIVVTVIPAGLCVAGGRPDGDVLVEAEDVLQITSRQRFHHRQLGGAGVAEDVGDAVGFEGVDEQVRAGVLGGHTGAGAATHI
jgi:hypothetical protein